MTLKQICLDHGVRPKEREYIRLLTIEWLKERQQGFGTTWQGSSTINVLLEELDDIGDYAPDHGWRD